MDLDDWSAAGLYDPDVPDAADRCALLEFLAERGATLDDMVEAAQTGGLVALAGDLNRRTRMGPRLSAVEVAAAAGVSVELVMAISRAAGLPALEIEQKVYGDPDIETIRAFAAGSEMFGQDATLQFTRTMGASLAAIADAAMASFGLNVAPDLGARGATELEHAQAIDTASAMLAEVVPPAMINLFAHHVEAAARRSIASTSESAGLVQLTVGFLDLADSTRMIRGLSPAELAAAIGDFERAAVEAVSARDGRVVKTIGDEVMFVVPDAAGACEAALALRDMVADHAVLTALRGGLAFGGLTLGYGDFYGPDVNRAARIAKLAEPGQILVTEPVESEVGASKALRFATAGEHELSGFDGVTNLLAVEHV